MIALACGGDLALAAEPKLSNDRYQLELVASEPAIVTPIGMTFDREGRLLVVESHTHKRTSEYEGPEGDRIRIGADTDGDGRLDRWTTWADGLLHAMNVLARPDGGVYVLARHQLLLLRDTDGDGRADQRREIMHLETEDDYPHNGLGGIAQLADGSLLVCMGENHGFAYTLTGSDGTTLSGTGGLDGVIHATADGGELRWLAHGVWNPFSICVDPHGRMFAVDNDPDASPPCRLLHIVPGGDYGYLFQYGRAGTHPLQAWNGELPGTLPMVCGVGEAPTAIVAHAGTLWVTSWGDHRVERYRLIPRGVSYVAEREIVVQGNADFRPTGMAVAPDGSIYFGDWRRRDYEVHNTGRIWRLELPAGEENLPFPPPTQQDLHTTGDIEFAIGAADSDDPFGRASATWYLSRGDTGVLINADSSDRLRLCGLQAERLRGTAAAEQLLRAALRDKSPDVRLYAVRWISDERIVELRDDVAALLDEPLPNPGYYLAVLAAVDWLDHEPSLRNRGVNDELLVRELQNGERPPAVSCFAVRLLSPDHKFLSIDRLREYVASADPGMRREAVRTLAMKTDTQFGYLLAEVAVDETQIDDVRADAIAGLAAFADQPFLASTLQSFHESSNPVFRREAERAMRMSGRQRPDESKPLPTDLVAWSELLAEPGDVAAGRRIFFSAVGPRGSVCHQHDGRGGTIGPDLTHIGRVNSRERIIASILLPSQEIAPHYQPWVLLTDDGKTHAGLRLAKAGDDGVEPYADTAGRIFTLRSESVESRAASQVSIMPDGLEKTLSIADLRDLVTFLMTGDGK